MHTVNWASECRSWTSKFLWGNKSIRTSSLEEMASMAHESKGIKRLSIITFLIPPTLSYWTLAEFSQAARTAVSLKTTLLIITITIKDIKQHQTSTRHKGRKSHPDILQNRHNGMFFTCRVYGWAREWLLPARGNENTDSLRVVRPPGAAREGSPIAAHIVRGCVCIRHLFDIWTVMGGTFIYLFIF